MHPSPLRPFLLSLVLTAASVAGQDISYPAFGNPAGQTFQTTAPTGTRIQALHVNHGGSIDGFTVYYEDAFGAYATSSPQCGGSGGIATWFNIGDNDYLLRIELWYDPVFQQIRGMKLQTKLGQIAMFGQAVGGFHYFHALGDTELIGLHGSYGAQLQSLGVVTRPVLASQTRFGTGCAGPFSFVPELDLVEIAGVWPHYEVPSQLRIGHTTTVRSMGTMGDLVAIDFAPVPMGGLALGSLGLPGNCTLYVAPTVLVEANMFFPYQLAVPNDANLVGSTLWLQGVSWVFWPQIALTEGVAATIGTI